MKYTIADIEKKVQDAAAARARMEQEQAKAAAEKAEYERKADAAADAGDVESFLKLKQQAEHAEAVSYIMHRQLEKKIAPVSAGEVNIAWADYANTYGKALASELAKLEKAKDALLSEYAKLISMQEEALAARARMAGYVDMKDEQLSLDFIPLKAFTPNGGVGQVVPAFGNDPYAAFYLANKVRSLNVGELAADKEYTRVWRAVYNRKK